MRTTTFVLAVASAAFGLSAAALAAGGGGGGGTWANDACAKTNDTRTVLATTVRTCAFMAPPRIARHYNRLPAGSTIRS